MESMLLTLALCLALQAAPKVEPVLPPPTVAPVLAAGRVLETVVSENPNARVADCNVQGSPCCFPADRDRKSVV